MYDLVIPLMKDIHTELAAALIHCIETFDSQILEIPLFLQVFKHLVNFYQPIRGIPNYQTALLH